MQVEKVVKFCLRVNPALSIVKFLSKISAYVFYLKASWYNCTMKNHMILWKWQILGKFRNYWFAFLGLVFSLMSCSEKMALDSISEDDAIIWKTSLPHYLSEVFFYKNQVVYFTQKEISKNKLVALAPNTGELLWESDAFALSQTIDRMLDIHYFTDISGNIFLISDVKNTLAFDLDSHKLIWKKTRNTTHIGGMSIAGNKLFVSTSDKSGSSLWSYELNSGIESLVLSLTPNDFGSPDFSPNVGSPVKWTNPSGETILIMANFLFHHQTEDSSRMDVFAWNLDDNSPYWYAENIDVGANSRPLIEDNRVYFKGINSVMCLDAADGKVIWKTPQKAPLAKMNGPLIWLAEDKLVVIGEEPNIFALDKETGKTLWTSKKHTHGAYANTRYHDGKVWSNGSGLLGFDAHTGAQVHQWNYGQPFWQNTTCRDPNSNHIFTANYEYLFCLDPFSMD